MYSFGGGDVGSLPFLLPKLPFHNTESLNITMADMAGSLVAAMLVLKSTSTWSTIWIIIWCHFHQNVEKSQFSKMCYSRWDFKCLTFSKASMRTRMGCSKGTGSGNRGHIFTSFSSETVSSTEVKRSHVGQIHKYTQYRRIRSDSEYGWVLVWNHVFCTVLFPLPQLIIWLYSTR